MNTLTAVFAAGCFWGVEASFRNMEGVTSTRVGYTGGTTRSPTYEDVCSGRTGHAEAVEVTFDPKVVSYEELLRVFWETHDPTQLNRQGLDRGTQYRSAIFFSGDEQEVSARSALSDESRSGRHSQPVVTEVSLLGAFWVAEDYHQQYLQKRGWQVAASP